MLTTTFDLARSAGACTAHYRKFAKSVGGIRSYGKDTPIELTRIAEVCGILNALWCLRCTQQPQEAEKLNRLLAADYSRRIYPKDNRPRWATACNAAWDAGAAANAARHTAGVAAWADEQAWQLKHFKAVVLSQNEERGGRKE